MSANLTSGMAVVEPNITTRSVQSVAEALRDVIGAGDRGQVGSLLGQLVAEAPQGDVAEVVSLRNRVDRVARRLKDLEDDPVGGYALGYLECADHDLARLRTRMLGEAADQRRAEEQRGLRSRVLAELVSPRRPGDVAAKLQVHRSQVSREIRALCEEGVVVPISPPISAHDDKRATWYAQVQLAVATAS